MNITFIIVYNHWEDLIQMTIDRRIRKSQVAMRNAFIELYINTN